MTHPLELFEARKAFIAAENAYKSRATTLDTMENIILKEAVKVAEERYETLLGNHSYRRYR